MRPVVSCNQWYHATSGIMQPVVSCAQWYHAISGNMGPVTIGIMQPVTSGIMQPVVSCDQWYPATSGIPISFRLFLFKVTCQCQYRKCPTPSGRCYSNTSKLASKQ
ncbi:hypothetical protein ElyMa_002403100 [Elysia marginata]|uniref:Uncharacterized protein n=1 Tax=Elysia marginata TaxID=1093978 RepID=A0AAV4GFU0_9GAST|nr:hypothetical protein ElyMa_002403100 [Elysia marginata]